MTLASQAVLLGAVLGLATPVHAASETRTRTVGVEVSRHGPMVSVRQRVVVENPRGVRSESDATLMVSEGLTISKVERLSPQPLVGRVMPDQEAHDTFITLRGRGDAPAEPLVLLRAEWGREVRLAVSPLGPRQRVEIALTGVALLAMNGGRLAVLVPCPRGVTPRAAGARVVRHAADESCTVSYPGPPSGVVAHLGLVAVAGASWAMVTFTSAAALEPLPRDLRLVFLIDTSWSEGESGIETQLALVRATVQHTPRAQVAVIAWSRRARPVTRGFVPATRLEAALRRGQAALEPEHGSDPAVGLAAAARLLAARPGPSRVILMTDRQLASTWRDAQGVAAFAGAPADAVVHVVLRHGQSFGALEVERLDTLADPPDDFAGLLTATGGEMLELMNGDSEPEALGKAALELVRPLRLDELSVRLEGHDVELAGDEPLEAGRSERQLVRVDRAPARLTVRGRLWSRTVVVEATPEGALAEGWAALAAHDEAGLDLAGRTWLGLERGLVTTGTSALVATGRGPQVAGFDEPRAEWGAGRMGICCDDAGPGGIGFGGRIGQPERLLLQELKAMMGKALRRCGVDHPREGALITVEIDEPELLRVVVEGDDAHRACIEEALWLMPRLDGLGHVHVLSYEYAPLLRAAAL